MRVQLTPPLIAPGPGAGCCRVFAEGVQLGNCTVATPDLNGAAVGDGVNGIDYEVLLAEIAASNSGAPYRGRDDLNHDGNVNISDLSTLLSYLGSGGSDGPRRGSVRRGVLPMITARFAKPPVGPRVRTAMIPRLVVAGATIAVALFGGVASGQGTFRLGWNSCVVGAPGSNLDICGGGTLVVMFNPASP